MNQPNYKIGIDIGGTNTKALLFDGKKVISHSMLSTPKDSLEHLLVILKALIEPLEKTAIEQRKKVESIGISVAGIVSSDKSKIIYAPNIPILNGVALAQIISKKHLLPTLMDNDSNCFLHAEMVLGVGKKYSNAFGIAIGTGIGASWWSNGSIYNSNYGSAMEIGWSIIGCDDPIALETAYHRLAQNNPEKLAREAYQDDPLAKKSYEEIGRLIGISLVNIINLLGPEIIIIGGSVIRSGNLFLSEANEMIRKYAINPEAKRCKLILSKLTEQASAIGATLLTSNSK